MGVVSFRPCLGIVYNNHFIVVYCVMMIYKLLIVMMLIFGGCTINIPSSVPIQTVEKTEQNEQIGGSKLQKEQSALKLWPHEKKEYWYAKYFLSMAMDPGVQRMMKPEHVFAIVKCTVDGFEKDYEYEQFLEVIGDNRILPPQINKYIRNLAYVCSQEVQRKMKEELNKKLLTNT
jgi:hypothetical protein